MKILKSIALAIATISFTFVAFRMIKVWNEQAANKVRDEELQKNIKHSNEVFNEKVNAMVVEISKASADEIEKKWLARFGVKEESNG